MGELERLRQILRHVGMAPNDFLVSGSAVIFLHGIDRPRPMGDLDLFVPTRTWFELQARTVPSPRPPDDGDARRPVWEVWTPGPGMRESRCDPPYLRRFIDGLEVNVFFSWRRRGIGDIDVNLWYHNAEWVGGYRCVPLPMVLHWKEEMGRSKDLDDILLLRRHFLGDSAE